MTSPSTPEKNFPENLPPAELLRRDFENQKLAVHQRTIEQLQKIAGAEARVRTFAKLMDKYGVDVLVGLFPEIGDAASSTIAGIYLLFEAQKAELSKFACLKIIGLQTADFFVGAVPIAGDVLDYLFKANKWSAELFAQKKAEVIAKARAAGIPENEIAMIDQSAEKLPQLAQRIVSAVMEQNAEKLI
ncbi:MAG: DUF4112 domain-containing protein [Patescibacteria group bacterium]